MMFDLPDSPTLYQALITRDDAYEGRAYVGVTSTGIFCRLTCPARNPKYENCRFYASPGQCIEAGFRACKRCKPLAAAAGDDPMVQDLLARLEEQRIPICVASHGSEDKMRITLGQNGLWERFHPSAMFSAHSLGVSKPDPGLFLAAASHFGVQARDCLVIEDSATGALAAARAGMRCLGFVPDGDGRTLAAQGGEIFTDMAQVPALIGL